MNGAMEVLRLNLEELPHTAFLNSHMAVIQS